MEKLLYIMLIWVVSTTSIYSQTVAGKIVDESKYYLFFDEIQISRQNLLISYVYHCLILLLYMELSVTRMENLPYPKIHLKGYYAFHL